MEMTARLWSSMNSFALTKVWFSYHTFDLRVCDISSIQQSEKLRSQTCIGLGLHHVKTKALAILTGSFIDTAINPQFLQSQYYDQGMCIGIEC